MPKEKPELKCCISCGRDTASKSAICVQCVGRTGDGKGPPKKRMITFTDAFPPDHGLAFDDNDSGWPEDDEF